MSEIKNTRTEPLDIDVTLFYLRKNCTVHQFAKYARVDIARAYELQKMYTDLCQRIIKPA